MSESLQIQDCSAYCQDRYESTDQDILDFRDSQIDKGNVIIAGRGCLGICNTVLTDYPNNAIVNFVARNKDGIEIKAIAYRSDDGSIQKRIIE